MTDKDDSPPDGLICAFEFDGRGGARDLGRGDLDGDYAGAAVRWFHFDFRAAEARRWLLEDGGIERGIAEALIDDDSRPRSIEYGHGLLVIFRGVNSNAGSQPEDMVSIRIWMEGNRIISTRRRRLASVRHIREDLAAGRGPRDVVDFLITLARRLGDRIGPVVEEIDDQLEKAEAGAGTAGFGYRGQFSNLRRQAVRIRRHLAPQRDGLERMAKQGSFLLSDVQRLELREEADVITRCLEDLDLIRERAMVAQEEMIGQLAQEQNSRIYTLSLVAAVFLPLSFLTGLMGMNVAGLPGTENPIAFTVLSLMMIGAAAGILLLFRWRRWL